MAKSVRYSCANGQNPFSISIGHFVVTNATSIMIKGGMEASLINIPAIINAPQIISKAPVKYAQNAGSLNPIFKNLPVPNNSGNKYFWIPSVRKMNPTTNRTNNVRLSTSFLKKKEIKPLFDFIAVLINCY